MPPSSNSFYVVVPSNTNVEGNRANSFRVRLPRKLQFSAEWDVGLAVIVYPHSWPSLGTAEEQFVQVDWRTGHSVRIQVPPSNVTNPEELAQSLYKLLGEGSKHLAEQTRTAQLSFNHVISAAYQAAMGEFINERRRLVDSNVPERDQLDSDESYQKKLDAYFEALAPADKKLFGEIYQQKTTEEIAKMHKEDLEIYNSTREVGGFEAWIQAYRKVRIACQFAFESLKNRFSLRLDPRYVKRVKISEQLAYILGFNVSEFVERENVARFMPDMSGGVSSFHVYAPDLVEPMMIGDVSAPLLRMVTIRGRADEVVEEQFLAIQYHRVLIKEFSEIFVEIRTSAGALMPFQYGTCTLTLHFRKAAYF